MPRQYTARLAQCCSFAVFIILILITLAQGRAECCSYRHQLMCTFWLRPWKRPLINRLIADTSTLDAAGKLFRSSPQNTWVVEVKSKHLRPTHIFYRHSRFGRCPANTMDVQDMNPLIGEGFQGVRNAIGWYILILSMRPVCSSDGMRSYYGPAMLFVHRCNRQV